MLFLCVLVILATRLIFLFLLLMFIFVVVPLVMSFQVLFLKLVLISAIVSLSFFTPDSCILGLV